MPCPKQDLEALMSLTLDLRGNSVDSLDPLKEFKSLTSLTLDLRDSRAGSLDVIVRRHRGRRRPYRPRRGNRRCARRADGPRPRQARAGRRTRCPLIPAASAAPWAPRGT